ncbi:MAG TPA: tannase/feruloyl esterase family alpha/beta hydrolase [Caulobacteraceae bacterium]
MRILSGLAAALACALLMAAPRTASARELTCVSLRDIALDRANVTKVTTETLGQTISACRLQVTAKPTRDSDIRIEVWIPIGAAWNGKFVQLGNGGFAGSIRTAALQAMAARGYAVAATDDGHQSDQPTDGRWAMNHPEKITDFGWRALKQTTDIAKMLIAAQKGTGPGKSYFTGCSDGGREALMEAQRFPNDFDGIVAGAPANDFTHLLGYAVSQGQTLMNTPGAYIGPPQLAVLQVAALSACAGEGGYIRDPLACAFDPARAVCKAGQDPPACLTAEQVAAARNLYAGLRDPRSGKIILPGLTFGGEAQPGGWADWVTGPSKDKFGAARSNQFGANFFKYFAFSEPGYDILRMDLAVELDQARAKLSRDLDAVDPNLGGFKSHGGKLIQYHGWNDPAIPARSSIVYYEDVQKTLGPAAGFYKLYMVPGMLHCGGGAGPGNVDWLSLLDRWVTTGEAPGAVMAASDSPFSPEPPPADGPTQLLCPYPQVAARNSPDPCSPAVPAAPKRRPKHRT